MKNSSSGTRTTNRNMWNGSAEPEGVVGMGKKGAIPVPVIITLSVVVQLSLISQLLPLSRN